MGEQKQRDGITQNQALEQNDPGKCSMGCSGGRRKEPGRKAEEEGIKGTKVDL